MKITKVKGNGTYEYFQYYSNDPYLGKSLKEQVITPLHQTAPIPGSTLREGIRTKMKKFGIVVRSVNG